MSTGSDQNKEFEPTQKKLDESRRKGDIAKSADLTTAIGLSCFVILAFFYGDNFLQSMGMLLKTILAGATTDWQDSEAKTPSPNLAAEILAHLAPIFLLPGLAVLAYLAATRSLIVSAERIIPKLEKISPLANARQKYGATGWIEFFKSFAKLSCAIFLVYLFMKSSLPKLRGISNLDVRPAIILFFAELLKFLTASAAIAIAIGMVDLVWQKFKHNSKLRMTRQELKQETKESEGDPDIKQRRRQKAYDIATNQMLRDVPGAQVIIVNPQHYAVALKWNKSSGTAPICLAKGLDEVAMRIRQIAQESGVPIHQDPPTARALYATVKLGAEVQPELYPQVAAAIRFAEKMRQRASALR